jgi:hypothetical protein
MSAPMMCYTSIASQLFVFAIADPLLEPTQKSDSPCLPNLELLSFAIADPFSALTNAVDSSCLPNCDRTQIISTDSNGVSITYNYVLYGNFLYNYLIQGDYTEIFWVTQLFGVPYGNFLYNTPQEDVILKKC